MKFDVYTVNLHVACMVVLIALTSNSSAIDCPNNPEQARKDWEVEVRAAVGKIGPAKGAELETLTRSTTRDLVGKLPQADKVYLEQMMYATYCSTLRDDTSLTESQKSARIKAYNLEVRKTLHATQGEETRFPIRVSSRDAARAELAKNRLKYTPDAFVESAKNGNLTAVKLFLAAGMDPNVKDESENTAMIYAAGNGHTAVVEALLKAKARVNERNEGGYTALSWAASDGHKDVLRLLLESGADNKAINDAFLSAAKNGQPEMLRMLLIRGADKSLGGEALRRAAGSAMFGVSEADLNGVVNVLLAQSVEVNSKDDEGWTALLNAAHWKRALLLQTLLDAGADVNAKCSCSGYLSGGWTALMIATRNADMDMVNILLSRGADPNLSNNDGKTALIIAVEEKIENMVRVLLDKGANVNAKDNDGRTALMWSSWWGKPDAMRILLGKGADVNAKSGDGGTALMWAAMHSDSESIKVLLDAGADLHAKSTAGRTALMLAVREGRSEQVRSLLLRGAKINDEDASGKTVLDYAEESEKPMGKEVLRILKKGGIK